MDVTHRSSKCRAQGCSRRAIFGQVTRARAHARTCARAHARTCAHTVAHTLARAHKHTRTHKHKSTHEHERAHAFTLSHTYSRMHARTLRTQHARTRPHASARARTQTHRGARATHTHIHTHTHTNARAHSAIRVSDLSQLSESAIGAESAPARQRVGDVVTRVHCGRHKDPTERYTPPPSLYLYLTLAQGPHREVPPPLLSYSLPTLHCYPSPSSSG